jgi:hypothetical protein
MGLFDGYFDQDQFQDGGGLLGRLLSLQQQQDQYQPGTGFDQAPSAAQTPATPSMPSPMVLNNVQPSAVPPMGAQDLKSQYAALLPILGDHKVTIATVNPEMGKTLIAQALAGQQESGNTGDVDLSGNGHAGPGNEASSVADGLPPGLSQVGYLETPTNANQAAGELQGIQQSNPSNTISGKDYVSGIREGNVRRNPDKSLDVTNGTVVTFSYKDGHAKTVTVTNTDVAHIDPGTGEVVIQKAPLGDGI